MLSIAQLVECFRKSGMDSGWFLHHPTKFDSCNIVVFFLIQYYWCFLIMFVILSITPKPLTRMWVQKRKCFSLNVFYCLRNNLWIRQKLLQLKKVLSMFCPFCVCLLLHGDRIIVNNVSIWNRHDIAIYIPVIGMKR